MEKNIKTVEEKQESMQGTIQFQKQGIFSILEMGISQDIIKLNKIYPSKSNS